MPPSNNPPVTLEVDRELAEFITKNCDSNIKVALGLLVYDKDNPSLGEDSVIKLVSAIGQFKRLKSITDKAMNQ